MSIKKAWALGDKEAEAKYEHALNLLKPVLSPYFKKKGALNLSESEPIFKESAILAEALRSQIILNDPELAHLFSPDDVLAKKIIVKHDRFIQFWGIIWWLNTPPYYQVNSTEMDPFYCEFSLKEDSLLITRMCFGDYDLNKTDNIWWCEMNTNWIYDFVL